MHILNIEKEKNLRLIQRIHSHHIRRERLEIPTLIEKRRRIWTIRFYEDLMA